MNDPGTKNVTVTVGGTTEVMVDDDVTFSGNTENPSIATVTTEPVQTEAGTKYTPVTTTLEAGTYYISATENDPAPETEVTIEKNNNIYWVKVGRKY